MGQRVSADREPSDLKALLRQARPPTSTVAGREEGVTVFEGGVKHHVKAWKFEKTGRSVSDSPAQLCDKHGLLAVDLQRSCSYLILHIHSAAPGADESGACPPGEAAVLEELTASASATCSPRGLAIEVVAQSEATAWEEGGMKLSYAIFAWHGTSVDPHVKARVFTKAFELDTLLQSDLVSQANLWSSPGGTVALRGFSCKNEGASSSKEEEPADKVRQSGNRLLSAMLDGATQAGKNAASLLAAATSPPSSTRRSGKQRFPRLGLSVCRSLGVVPAADGWFHRSSATPATPAPPLAASAPSGNSVPLVPRLQLGGALKKGDVHCDETFMTTSASMDVDSTESEPLSSGRKRCRAPDLAAQLPLRSAVSSDTPATATVPKSARTDVILPLQSPRLDPNTGQCEGGDPAGQHRPRNGVPGNIPLLKMEMETDVGVTSQSLQQPSNRTDAPAMLDLEEINMTEEELIRSYDPENEENNYHLPHHLYKKLQLDQFRPVCSEVVPGSLFIGSIQVAHNLEVLQRHGITHIVNTARDACTNAFEGQFIYLTYYLKDINSEDISILFYRTLKWVDDAIQSGGRVLIHCREGVSRSSTMIIAYLMWKYSLPYDTAHERLRRVRTICNPNTGFICELLKLGRRLGVAGQPQAPPSDRLCLFRVSPYHPKEPFLLLFATEWSSPPNFDPRFGWVVQRGLEAVLWIGAQVANAEATKKAVEQHLSLLHLFERIVLRLSVVQDGLEPLQFWQLLGLPGAPSDRSQIAVTRPDLDADADILASSHGAVSEPAIANDLEISSPRVEEDDTTSPDCSPSSDESFERSAPAIPERPAAPPAKVPSLALGGLLRAQPPSE